MNPANGTGWKFFFVLVCIMSCLGYIACAGGDSQPGEDASVFSDQKSDSQKAAEEAASDDVSTKAPAGWQTARHEEWTVSFPPDWNVDPDTGIWQPGEVGPFRGRPAISVFMGGIPVMAPADFEERIKTRNNGEPQERVDVSVAGFSGFKCSWENQGKKYRGLFLEEKIAGGMIVIHFFDCQAPADVFEQYQADFEKILDSVRK